MPCAAPGASGHKVGEMVVVNELSASGHVFEVGFEWDFPAVQVVESVVADGVAFSQSGQKYGGIFTLSPTQKTPLAPRTTTTRPSTRGNIGDWPVVEGGLRSRLRFDVPQEAGCKGLEEARRLTRAPFPSTVRRRTADGGRQASGD